MARFAPVAPPRLMLDMKKKGILGNYHLLLAHDVAAQPDLYQEALYDVVFDDNDSYIIMDNSVIELGHPVPLEIMDQACAAIPPDVIVLPDVLLECELTIVDCASAAHLWSKHGIGPFLVAPQGKTFEEIMHCAKELLELPNIKALGIPRNYTSILGSRMSIAKLFHEMAPEMDIHLLGFSDDLLDDFAVARQPFVKGIDSAVPLRIGLAGMQIDPLKTDYPPRGDYWDIADVCNDVVISNLKDVREWVGGPSA